MSHGNLNHSSLGPRGLKRALEGDTNRNIRSIKQRLKEDGDRVEDGASNGANIPAGNPVSSLPSVCQAFNKYFLIIRRWQFYSVAYHGSGRD